MKIAILGDFHLGYPRFYEDSFSQAERAFKKACETADLIVLAGDIFDTKTPRLEVIERSLRIFGIAKEKKWEAKSEGETCLPVVAIHGTHERRQKDSANVVQVVEAAGAWKDVHNKKAVFSLGSERVAVQGLGGVPEEYAAVAMKAAGFSPLKGAFNILVFHQSIEELIPGKGETLSLEDLPPGFDLYICGHMHKNYFGKAQNGDFVIPGSTVVTQMRKEESGKKGFVMFDTKAKRHDFVEIETRPFFFREIELKEASGEEVKRKIREEAEALIGKAKDKPIIKIKVAGTLAKGLKPSDVGRLEGEFSDRAFLSVDIGLEEQALAKSLELLKELKGKRLSVREMGLEILKKKLKEAKCTIENPETLFDSLAEGNGEGVVREIAEKAKKN
ncbi:MAG: DNA repair exonuclease [Candidatus Micrarchaeota archaeon]